MDDATRQLVRRRAEDRCEYCHLPQSAHEERFSIDHVIPRKHGGRESAENLALSCLRCNLSKGPNLSGIDSQTGLVTELFNPRIQHWRDHLKLEGAILVGTSPTGRATVTVLRMNDPHRVQLRQALLNEGVFPLK